LTVLDEDEPATAAAPSAVTRRGVSFVSSRIGIMGPPRERRRPSASPNNHDDTDQAREPANLILRILRNLDIENCALCV
jgi:hypothetical protein